MTVDANGRAHHAAGSPASIGGQYAKQAAPAAAATLEAVRPEYDLSTRFGREMQRVREMPLDSLHPRQIDGRYVEVLAEYQALRGTQDTYQRTVDRYYKDASRSGGFRSYEQRQLEHYEAKLEQANADVEDMGRALDIYDAEFGRRGGWTRGFLVTNTNGHLHKSRSCSTCFPTTQFVLLPHYSGADQAKIVEDAGEMACTTCYPDAPVDTLRRASRLVGDPAREAKEQREAEKAAREAAKAVKAVTDRDGKALRIPDRNGGRWMDEVKTEVSAQRHAVEDISEVIALAQPHAPHDHWIERITQRSTSRVPQLIDALARKREQTPEQVLEELRPKAVAKASRDTGHKFPKDTQLPQWLLDAIQETAA